MARAIPTRCFCPPLSCTGKRFALSARPTSVKISATRGAILLRSQPAAFRLNATFCATVRVCIKLKCWKIIPIRCRAWRNAFPSSAEISTPLTLTRPWLGRVKAFRVRSRVLFPAPLVPTMPKISPAAICRLTSSTARVGVPRPAVKSTQTFSISIIFTSEIGDGYRCDQGVAVIHSGFWKAL